VNKSVNMSSEESHISCIGTDCNDERYYFLDLKKSFFEFDSLHYLFVVLIEN
jgi:hypothetical protein